MRKPDPVEQALQDVHRAATAQELARFLRHKSGAVIARAARKAVEIGGEELTAELIEAFRRLMKDPARLDKGCRGLIDLATALAARDASAAEVYCEGMRHVQMEGSFGPPVDAAAPLRGVCAIGLVRTSDPEALFRVLELLLDRWPEARSGAIRALGESGRPEAELVLRYKARIGDTVPEVMSECFAAVLRLGPRVRALPFIAGFLDGDEEAAEAAALALGESRIAEAFPLLRDAFKNQPGSHSAILLGMALLRHDGAIEFLFEQLRSGRARTAAAALEALAIYRTDAAILDRARSIIAGSADHAIRKVWTEHWGGDCS